LHGYAPAIVTGKPVELGGSLGREAATGRGVSYILNETAKDLGLDVKETKVVIQGFGNVGLWAARLMHNSGYSIIGVSDVNGGVYNPHGLNITLLESYVKAGGKVSEFNEEKQISNAKLLELACDVLIPAAIDNVITKENALSIKAPLILEAANHPITPEADHILSEKGVTILPDILVNAGGVIVSYFEWTQNLQQFHWEENQVNDELKKILIRAYHEVRELALSAHVTHRQAAFEIGVQRVAQVIELRGFV